jgi:hypothetical protein
MSENKCSILAATPFEIVSLGMHTAIPLFFYASKALWKSVSLMLLTTARDCLWMSETVSKRPSFSFIFNLGGGGGGQS